MRQIGQLATADDATRFTAFLQTQNVKAFAEQEGDAYVIWVRDENQIDQAKDELAKFQREPTSSIYLAAVGRAEAMEKEEADRRKRVAKNLVVMKGRWKNPRAGVSGNSLTPGVGLLIGASILVSVLTGFGGSQKNTVGRMVQFADPVHTFNARWLVDADLVQLPPTINHRPSLNDLLAARTIDIRQGEVWRLVTPIFWHGGVMHLFFNMYWLFQLGTQIEKRYGLVPFLGLVLGIALFEGPLQALLPGSWGGSPFGGGMSGVVYGLLGFVWLKSRYDPSSGFYLSNAVMAFMVIFLAVGFTGVLDNLVGGRIANWAHLGGLIAGLIAAAATLKRR